MRLRALVLCSLVSSFSACNCGNGTIIGNTGGGTGNTGGGSGNTGGGTGSTGGGGGSGVTVTSLVFDPLEATVVLDGSGMSKSTNFQLMEVRSDGSMVPVEGQNLFFDRPDLGSAATGNPVVVTVATNFAGTGTLTATRGMLTASAKLHVKQQVLVTDPAVPPAVVTALQAPGLAADTALTNLLYPYDKTVFPLGLMPPLVMWTPPSMGDTYLMRLERSNYRFEQVFPSPANGQIRAPQQRWDEVTTASQPTDPLVVTLIRYDAASSTAFTSVRHEWTMSAKSLRGAIYYWTTSLGGKVSRIRPGAGSMPETIGGSGCVGCHAVSADGTRLVASLEAAPSNDTPGVGDRAWVTFDLPSLTEVKRSTNFAANMAINPNGKYVVYGTSTLKLGDAATGDRIPDSGIEDLPLDMGMVTHAHPAFSPDGKKLVTVQSSGSWVEWGAGHIVVTAFDEANLKFSNPQTVLSSSVFPMSQRSIGYPSFTPDSQSIAFHVGDFVSGCNPMGCDENTPGVASLQLMPAAGGMPIPLTKLNDSSPLAADHNVSFEPTFNPLESGGYHWVVFTSTRDWGNQLTGAPRNGKKRLWVAALDKTTGTTDPSHPAFYLEGQENTMNMRGFWTLAACTATGPASTCTAGFECCSGFCNAGHCIDPGPIACRKENESCTTSSECCNSGSFVCKDGTCQPGIN